MEVSGLSKGYDGPPLFKGLNLMIKAGERIAVIGPNGIGKTTLLRCLVGDLMPDAGAVKWSENANIGYFAQDHAADFASDTTLVDWLNQWKHEGQDEQVLRSTLGRLLFPKDDIYKAVNIVSGGEQGRLLFGKLILQQPNVMVMDEPTNHMDMESIEALNYALENYPGTLIFVSHDREFVSSVATRIIELKPDGIADFTGDYENYLQSQGVE